MSEKKTAFWVRCLGMDQPHPHSATSPTQWPPVTRFPPSARRHANCQPHQQPRQQRAWFLFPAVLGWLLFHLQGYRWTLLLRRLAAQSIRAPWGATLLLPHRWPHRLPRCSHRVITRTDIPPPAAEPVLIFQLRKSCHRLTLPNRILTLSAPHHRHSHCQDPHSRRYFIICLSGERYQHQLPAWRAVITNVCLLSSASSHTDSYSSTSSQHCWSDSSCWSHDAVQLQCLWARSASLVLLQTSGIKECMAAFQHHRLASAGGDVQLRCVPMPFRAICERFHPECSEHSDPMFSVGLLFFQFNQTQKMWSYVPTEAVMMCSSMTAYGPPSTGRRSLQRSGAALGSSKGMQIVALFLTLRSLVTSWRFVSL